MVFIWLKVSTQNNISIFKFNKINIELPQNQLCLWFKHVRRSNNDCPFFSVFILFPYLLYL